MIRFTWENSDFLHIFFTDTITGEDLVNHALDIAGDERLDYTHYVLGDWSGYKHASIRHEDIRTLVAIMKSICEQICPHVKNATVMPPDNTGNALLAFYKMLADELPWQVEIFHTYEQAYEWFGLPLPDEYKQRDETLTKTPSY